MPNYCWSGVAILHSRLNWRRYGNRHNVILEEVNPLIQGLIIEGMSTTGKTSLFSALKKWHNQTPGAQKTLIAVSEHYSQVLHQDHGRPKRLQQQAHIELLAPHVEYIERLHRWIDSLGHTKQSNGLFYLFERFHLNHRAAFGDNAEIDGLERRLSKLNARCVLLTLSPDAVESRYIESRGPGWKSYVLQDGRSVSEACAQFVDAQDNLRKCAKAASIPTLEINTDGADWDDYARQIAVELSERETPA